MVKSFDEQPGIKSVVAGYTGGTTVNPTYEQVASLTTGHTEVVKITFDPNVISYAQLVEIYWHQTDSTDVAGQFQYREDSYRPVIFVNGPEQRQVAESSRDSLTASSCFNDPIVTQIENVKPFYPAEAVHQDFYWQNPFRFQIEEMGGRAQFIKQRWQCDRN